MKKQILILISFLFCIASFAMAGVTGKISGRITDANTGEPLAGANVVIEGTIQGAACDAEGDYYIINVAPGTYVVTASMMGYEAVRTTEVLVSVDRTITVNYPLRTTVIELAAVTAEAERREIRLDVAQSQVSATGEQIYDVPLVRDVEEFLSLQAGIQLDDGENIIRGGGMDQTQMVVDGLPMVNNVMNSPMNIVNLSAIQEITIIKGGFQAEYGNLRSGMINIVTKEGQRDYHGTIDYRYTVPAQKHRGAGLFDWDNYYLRSYLDPAVCWDGTASGPWVKYTQDQYPQFDGWDDYAEGKAMTADQAQRLFIWQHRAKGNAELEIPSSEELGHPHPGEYGNKPDVNMDLSLSGPVPVIGGFLGDMTFLISHRDFKEQYVYPTARDYEWNRNTFVKLTSRLSPSMKLGIIWSFGINKRAGSATAQGLGGMDGRGAYFPHDGSPMDVTQRMIGLTFDHVLSPSTFYNLRVSQVFVENDVHSARTFRDVAEQYVDANENGKYDAGEEWTDGNPDGVYNEGTMWPVAGADTTMDERPWGWYWVSGYQYALVDKMVIGGVGAGYYDLTTINTTNVKFDLTSQITKRNQLKTGFELVLDKYDIYRGSGVADQIPLDPTDAAVSDWQQSPIRGGVYIQNKFEYEGMVANIGLRADLNKPNTGWYTEDPYSDYLGKVFLGPDIYVRKDLFLDTVEDTPVEGKLTLSPRLGISHPISDVSKLFFSYGHYYSMPSSGDMFQVNWGSSSQGIRRMGNPGLEMPRTIAYELGYEHEIANLFLVSLTGYYKDVSNQIDDTEWENLDGDVGYQIADNIHYADVRGFEMELRKNYGRWITGWANYTYQVETEGLIGREANFEDPIQQAQYGLQNPVQERPMPRPYANAMLIVRTPLQWGPSVGGMYLLDQLSASLLFHYRSGSYLTWEPVEPFTLENNLQWKSEYYFDARFKKTLSVGRNDFEFFVDVVNLFDVKYLRDWGFSDDTDRRNYLRSLHLPMYDGDKYQATGGYTGGDDQVGDVKSDKDYIDMPNRDFTAWNTPRSITLGFNYSF